jgi:hypothetical protein
MESLIKNLLDLVIGISRLFLLTRRNITERKNFKKHGTFKRNISQGSMVYSNMHYRYTHTYYITDIFNY